MAAVLPARTDKGRSCRAKAFILQSESFYFAERKFLFVICRKSADSFLVCPQKTRKWKNVRDPDVCSGFTQILHLKELKRVHLDIHFHRKMLCFFFSIWPQKVPNHSTYDNTFKRRQIWVLARTFTHNVFYKGVQHVKLPADSQKSLAYTTADSTGKACQKLWKLMFVLI